MLHENCSFLQLGAKRGGLGATKVTANFDDIEREAIMAEKLKMEVCIFCIYFSRDNVTCMFGINSVTSAQILNFVIVIWSNLRYGVFI